MTVSEAFLPAVIKRFRSYKELGDKTFEQLSAADLNVNPSPDSNSIATIVQHFYGNAMSRWTNFLTEDGEKEWRKRDAEFEAIDLSREDILSFWNTAWELILRTLDGLTEADLTKTIYIRTEPLIVFDAILRQLSHYPYHVGQIVYVGKFLKNGRWKS